MKRVVFEDHVALLAEPFKEELDSGQYYEIPEALVSEMEAAWEKFCDAQEKVLVYVDNHPMRYEEDDIEVAPTVPILPPGVAK